MQIIKIYVGGLFGIFDHEISVNVNNRITIIHGPNSFGKTVILKLLNGLFNCQYSELRNIPFDSFKVEFDNGNYLEIDKKNRYTRPIKYHQVSIFRKSRTLHFRKVGNQ